MSPFQPDDECIAETDDHRNGKPCTVIDTCAVRSLVDGVQIGGIEYWASVMWPDYNISVINVEKIRLMEIEDRIPYLIAADNVLQQVRKNQSEGK